MCCTSLESPPDFSLKVKMMLKWIGTIGVIAAAAALWEKRASRPQTELETVAAAELRKVLRYAAPPTFLASVSSLEEDAAPLRWLGKAAGN